jgi:hypothetical protein
MTASTVPVVDLRRRLGAADDGSGEMLRRHAYDLGVDLELTEDWAGRVAVTEASAAELVAAAERRADERTAVKRRRHREIEAERDALDAAIGDAARTAYLDVLDREMRAGRLATAELAAWTAGVRAGLAVQDAAALRQVAEPAPASAPPRRWWNR